MSPSRCSESGCPHILRALKPTQAVGLWGTRTIRVLRIARIKSLRLATARDGAVGVATACRKARIVGEMS